MSFHQKRDIEGSLPLLLFLLVTLQASFEQSSLPDNHRKNYPLLSKFSNQISSAYKTHFSLYQCSGECLVSAIKNIITVASSIFVKKLFFGPEPTKTSCFMYHVNFGTNINRNRSVTKIENIF